MKQAGYPKRPYGRSAERPRPSQTKQSNGSSVEGKMRGNPQQCVEKYLKSLLTFRSVDFPKTHDLVVLLNLAGGSTALGIGLTDVEPLNRYPVEARYPGDWEEFTRQEAEEAVQLARKIRGAMRKHLPDVFQE